MRHGKTILKGYMNVVYMCFWRLTFYL